MSLTQAVDPRVLRAGYRKCGRLTRRFGTTYFWGAALLPRRHQLTGQLSLLVAMVVFTAGGLLLLFAA